MSQRVAGRSLGCGLLESTLAYAVCASSLTSPTSRRLLCFIGRFGSGQGHTYEMQDTRGYDVGLELATVAQSRPLSELRQDLRRRIGLPCASVASSGLRCREAKCVVAWLMCWLILTAIPSCGIGDLV